MAQHVRDRRKLNRPAVACHGGVRRKRLESPERPLKERRYDAATTARGLICVTLLGSTVMPIERTIVLDQLKSIAMTILGIILSLVPPALWFAWTETMLLAVIAIGIVSAAALIVLADSKSGGVEDPQAADEIAKRRSLADQSVAEIHRIFPLTYHHSLVERTRFRRAMERVRQILK